MGSGNFSRLVNLGALVGQERERCRREFCHDVKKRTKKKGNLRIILIRDNANLIRGIVASLSGKFFVRGDIPSIIFSPNWI